MNRSLSPWPRRMALAYIGLVVLTWALALSSSPFTDRMQTWPIIVALPWSLILFLGAPAALFGIFLAGLLNAGLLYVFLRGWAKRSTAPHRPLLLPPAA
jgi:hypothetical protein